MFALVRSPCPLTTLSPPAETVVRCLLQLLATASVAGGKKKKKKKKTKKPQQSHRAHVEGLPPACGGRQSTHDEFFAFLTATLAGGKTRAQAEAQAEWLLTDLEEGCTPGLAEDPAVFEKLEDLTWQVAPPAQPPLP